MRILPRRAGLGIALAVLVVAGAAIPLLRRVRSPAPRSAAPPADVLLITIDTLRADALGCYGNLKIETPNIDLLAREGLVFDSAHASNVITLASHVNILTASIPISTASGRMPASAWALTS